MAKGKKGPVAVVYTARSLLCLLVQTEQTTKERAFLERKFVAIKNKTAAEQASWKRYLKSGKSLQKPED